MSGTDLTTRTLHADALAPFLPTLGRLRVAVFREWPYLYDGDAAHEGSYIRNFAGSPNAAAVLAFDGEAVVGAATCQPMAETSPELQASFAAGGLPPAECCYFGESVLLPPYRGRGLGLAFLAGREAHARALGLTRVAFVSVKRDADDPRRPPDYVPLDGFWKKRGYRPRYDIVVRMSWKEVDGWMEEPHELSAWVKDL
ncbi:GNAT family N-acetyltransferase [Roseomonas sp. BN140053]|uniref:GNAT family N-acetyltransferase n=1 Tax=Roseomonas sp. BN140053 TaxID=3391898 RepID=UPI0039E7920E